MVLSKAFSLKRKSTVLNNSFNFRYQYFKFLKGLYMKLKIYYSNKVWLGFIWCGQMGKKKHVLLVYGPKKSLLPESGFQRSVLRPILSEFLGKLITNADLGALPLESGAPNLNMEWFILK